MSPTITVIIFSVVALLLGTGLTLLILRIVFNSTRKNVIKEDEIEAESIKKEKLLEAKEKYLNLKNEYEKEVNQRNNKILQAESRIKQRENQLNQQQNELQRSK